jgi:hypothetical protein
MTSVRLNFGGLLEDGADFFAPAAGKSRHIWVSGSEW